MLGQLFSSVSATSLHVKQMYRFKQVWVLSICFLAMLQLEFCIAKSHYFPKRSHIASMPYLQTISQKWYLFEL